MKINILFACILLAGIAAAQDKPALTDDLFQNKPALVMQHFPATQQGFQYAVFRMQPDEFLNRLEQFKKAGILQANKSATPQLMAGDIDAYSIILLKNYISNYGIDSVKQEHFYALINSEQPAPEEEIEKARNNMHTLKLQPSDSAKLHNLANRKMDFNNAALFKRSASFRRVLEDRINIALYEGHAEELMKGGNEALIKMNIVKHFTGNQFIRDHFAFTSMEDVLNRTKDTALVKKAYDALRPVMKDPYYVSTIERSYKNSITYADGRPAPDFSYQDVNGKTVSLKDLRGKYVYIDLWATWCGPCKAEIPSLTKIEERLHEKMHFVSISLDKVASHEAWKSFVITNQLKGIQLMVDRDFKSKFIESFNVAFIPRFILIDPEGKIKDGNAKRPSDPELVKELEALVAARE